MQNNMDLHQFLSDFQDHLAPKLDTYEQAIYLYIFRHSRLIGVEEVCIGFKSARKKMATGVGTKESSMSESTCYEKLESLAAKGFLERVSTERQGTRVKVKLPSEVPGLIPAPASLTPVDIEKIDFFEIVENRPLILEREDYRCFYCTRKIDDRNYVIEHVQSRPEGNNSYRNVVAACRQCNNRKNDSSADDWLRTLYREGFLAAAEFEERVSHIERLRAGQLKPAHVPFLRPSQG